MADFKKYAPKLLQLEGGFVNHPEDKGGITNCGITLETFRSFLGQDKTVKDLQSMNYGMWKEIMKTGYWDKCRADEIECQAIAELLVDWTVNSGFVAVRKVQGIIGCNPDGIVGPITLSLINTSDPEILFEKIWNARHQFYINIVKRNPSQRVFMNGWMNRLNAFKF